MNDGQFTILIIVGARTQRVTPTASEGVSREDATLIRVLGKVYQEGKEMGIKSIKCAKVVTGSTGSRKSYVCPDLCIFPLEMGMGIFKTA